MDEKFCPRCQETKPVTDFAVRSRQGLAGYCKPCMSDYFREYHARKYPNPNRRQVTPLTCAACHKTLERSAFYWDKRGQRSSQCKVCRISRSNARNKANRPATREASRRHYQKAKEQKLRRLLEQLN